MIMSIFSKSNDEPNGGALKLKRLSVSLERIPHQKYLQLKIISDPDKINYERIDSLTNGDNGSCDEDEEDIEVDIPLANDLIAAEKESNNEAANGSLGENTETVRMQTFL